MGCSKCCSVPLAGNGAIPSACCTENLIFVKTIKIPRPLSLRTDHINIYDKVFTVDLKTERMYMVRHACSDIDIKLPSSFFSISYRVMFKPLL